MPMVLSISTPVVEKIRRKLEIKGINGYITKLNPCTIWLHVVNVLMIRAPASIIEEEDKFREKILIEPNILNCYTLTHGGANFLLIFAFRNLGESERYFKRFHRKFPYISILNMQTSTWDAIWKDSKHDVYAHVLKNKLLAILFEHKQRRTLDYSEVHSELIDDILR